MPNIIREDAAAGALTGARMEITLITPGWGSSGYYSPAVLEQAAAGGVFPRGTQMHIDHMSETDQYERPAGSVATLAAALTEDARWEPNWVDPKTGVPGRLVAESRVVSKWRQTLSEMAEFIGISISAGAEVSAGDAEGRKGRIIEALLPGVLNRVDFVTVAGRGGQITEVLESAKAQEARNVGAWLEARLHSGFTQISDDMYGDGRLTREERITLSSALGDALTTFTARIEADAPQLFQRDLWQEPDTAVAAAESKNPPSNPAGVTTKKEAATMATTTIEEAELATLKETSGRVTALESRATEAEARAEAAEAALTRRALDDEARNIVAEAFTAAQISAPATVKNLAKGYELKEGKLDIDALKASIAESLAEIGAATGAGNVHGSGPSAVAETIATEADVLKALGRNVKGA